MLMRFSGRRHLVYPRLLIAAMVICASGCTTTPRQYWESLKGEGFPGWSESLASSARGSSKAAQPSGFFTDRRSEQIEKDLGGF
jgi:hypothetical protein